jgi:hypothetical protein
MVVKRISEIQGEKKRFLEDLLGQRPSDDEEVYIVILAGDERHHSSSAADRETSDDSSVSKNSRRCHWQSITI